VGVVHTIDAASFRIMKRKTVFDSVWTASAGLHLARFKFHGVTFGEPEFVAIEAQKRFELVVRAARHLISTTTLKALHHIMM
jgi:hypothetical protein